MTPLRHLGAQASRLLRGASPDLPVEVRDLLADLVRTAGIKKKLTPTDRFFSHVAFSPRCHLWMGATNARGEPVVRYQGRLTLAVRVAWTLERGTEPPPRLYHACPHKRCIRLSHRVMRLVPLRGTLGAPKGAQELTNLTNLTTWACPRGHVLLGPPPDGRCPRCRLLRHRRNRITRPDRMIQRLRAQPQGGASAPPLDNPPASS